jgi:hypothetical protein
MDNYHIRLAKKLFKECERLALVFSWFVGDKNA